MYRCVSVETAIVFVQVPETYDFHITLADTTPTVTTPTSVLIKFITPHKQCLTISTSVYKIVRVYN